MELYFSPRMLALMICDLDGCHLPSTLLAHLIGSEQPCCMVAADIFKYNGDVHDFSPASALQLKY